MLCIRVINASRDSVVSRLQNLVSLVYEQHRCVVEADGSMETLDRIYCKSRAVFRLWDVFWPVTTIISRRFAPSQVLPRVDSGREAR